MKRGKKIRYSKEIVIGLIIIVFLLLFLQVKSVFSAGSGQKDEIDPPTNVPLPAKSFYVVVPVKCDSLTDKPKIVADEIGIDYLPTENYNYAFNDDVGVAHTSYNMDFYAQDKQNLIHPSRVFDFPTNCYSNGFGNFNI